MKIHTLAIDNRNGTQSAVFATEHELLAFLWDEIGVESAIPSDVDKAWDLLLNHHENHNDGYTTFSTDQIDLNELLGGQVYVISPDADLPTQLRQLAARMSLLEVMLKKAGYPEMRTGMGDKISEILFMANAIRDDQREGEAA